MDAPEKGLIIHTSITMGYEIPWQRVHDLSLAAAAKVDLLEVEPKPFCCKVRCLLEVGKATILRLLFVWISIGLRNLGRLDAPGLKYRRNFIFLRHTTAIPTQNTL